MEFLKPAASLDGQIRILRERGMQIEHPDLARHYLQHLNYYRLTAYWLPLEEDHQTHQFKPGTCFEDALNLYSFDRALRLHLLDAIERVEISVRTQWAYYLAHTYGPHAHLDPAHSAKPGWHASNLSVLEKELTRSDETFIKHYNTKYTTPPTPPIWSICEVMSLGLLSRWITQLRPSDRSPIARVYGLDQRVFKAFLRHLTYVRNVCAHHSRMWNRNLTITMELPRKKPYGLQPSFNTDSPRKIYNTLVMLLYLMDQISPGHRWRQRLFNLLDEHTIEPERMGFPADFRDLDIWTGERV